MASQNDIELVLEHLGVSVTRSTAREITAFCPVHEKTMGRPNVNTPAMSMNAVTGAWICYSCGARGSLQSLVAELSGDADTKLTVMKLMESAKMERLVAPPKLKADDEPEVDEYTFSRFDLVPLAMAKSRYLDPELCDLYDVKWNPKAKTWVIPIRDERGDLKGWQEKRSGWVRNRPEGVAKSECLFGWELFRGETAIVVESPLDVVRMHTAGVEGGLATFGVNISEAQLRMLGGPDITRIIIAFDNDDAGKAGVRQLRKTHPDNRRRFFAYPKDYDYKDPGDMPAAAIREAVENASILPWWL